jgi:hypothetical protein
LKKMLLRIRATHMVAGKMAGEILRRAAATEEMVAGADEEVE